MTPLRSNAASAAASELPAPLSLASASTSMGPVRAPVPGSPASADFVTPRDVLGTFAVNSLNMQADASSHGIGGARAAAIAPLRAAAAKGGSGLGIGFVIPGGVTLDAAALTFSRAQENASALASLAMAGLPGTGIKTGPIDVEALASDHGAGNALAAALAGFDFSSGFDIESLKVQARQVNH